MSMHPNTLLVLALTPSGDGISNEIYQKMLTDYQVDKENYRPFVVNGSEFNHHGVFTCGCKNDDFQLDLPYGTIYLFDYVTWCYCVKIRWLELEKKKSDLEELAINLRSQYALDYEIFISANYL